MRTLLLAALTIVLGMALGVGAAVLRIRTTPWDPTLVESHETTPSSAETPERPAVVDGQAAKVVVDKADFDFGTLDIESSSGSHAFVFTNAGDASLSLKEGGTSCRCTMSKLEHETLPPGGSTKVTITWKPVEKPGPYQQTAKILTNDPAQPQVTLTVSGHVTAAMRLSPAELVFSRLTAGESATAETRLYCYLDTPVKVLEHKWSDAATAAYFDVALKPLAPEEVKAEPSAHSGVLISVTVKPGLPQGPLRQKLTLKTNTSASPALAIEGNIGSEIAVVGRGWDPDTGVLNLGEVSRSVGMQRRLSLVVRGPLRKDVTFHAAEVTPDVLKVSLGKPGEINQGAVVQIPLLIEIPADSHPANHLGSEQGRLGEILLDTTHPQVPKLRIRVRFAIEG
jgi:hypothetical protein